MALIQHNYMCSHLHHYVERYILTDRILKI